MAGEMEERNALREELLFLKKCQLSLLSLSLGGGAVVLGLWGDKASALSADIYLSLLILLLPCWVVWFDKATTITRIVGYLCILEAMIATGRSPSYLYVGWENALRAFRSGIVSNPWAALAGTIRRAILGWIRAVQPLCLMTRQKYWSINWWVFAALTVTALVKGRTANPSDVWYLALVLSILTALFSASVLGNLYSGDYAYEENLSKWKKDLETSSVQQYLKQLGF